MAEIPSTKQPPMYVCSTGQDKTWKSSFKHAHISIPFLILTLSQSHSTLTVLVSANHSHSEGFATRKCTHDADESRQPFVHRFLSLINQSQLYNSVQKRSFIKEIRRYLKAYPEEAEQHHEGPTPAQMRSKHAYRKYALPQRSSYCAP